MLLCLQYLLFLTFLNWGGGEAGGNKLILHNMNPSKEKKLTEQRLSTKM